MLRTADLLRLMSIRPVLALALLGAFCGFVADSRAQGSTSEPSVDARDVRAWLLRIHEAAGKRNFQGTFIVSGGGSVSSARIAHYCEGPNQYERIESLDGQQRHVFRHNDLVHTAWPSSRVVLVEQSQLMMSFPGLLQAGDDRIVDFYDVKQQGVDRVAGHEASVLIVQPRDAYRYGYRLWSEKSSGLLLRADVLGERGEVLETSAFSDVQIGVKPQPDSVLQPMKRLDGYRVIRPALAATRLEAEGWSLKEPAPGFRQVSCVKRSMQGKEAAQEADNAPVLQAIYSDGLTHVSLFIEPFNAQRHTRPMMTSLGATQTLMKRHGDFWVTVVGDVPAATLKAFAKGLERSR
jgi:sigma-E factor negative regulatory protein RseB